VLIETLPVPRDCEDGFAETFGARPEAYLDPSIRTWMSAFRLLDAETVDAGVRRLRADLRSGPGMVATATCASAPADCGWSSPAESGLGRSWMPSSGSLT